MYGCEDCKKWADRIDVAPVSFRDLIRENSLAIGFISVGIYFCFLLIPQIKIYPLSRQDEELIACLLGIVILMICCPLISICRTHGIKFIRNNLIGRTVICSINADSRLHTHEKSKYLDSGFLSYRVGGYFRQIGNLSPERRHWKVVKSWTGHFNDLALRDINGCIVKSSACLGIVEIEKITEENSLIDYINELKLQYIEAARENTNLSDI